MKSPGRGWPGIGALLTPSKGGLLGAWPVGVLDGDSRPAGHSEDCIATASALAPVCTPTHSSCLLNASCVACRLYSVHKS